jgi:hypothetical protein
MLQPGLRLGYSTPCPSNFPAQPPSRALSPEPLEPLASCPDHVLEQIGRLSNHTPGRIEQYVHEPFLIEHADLWHRSYEVGVVILRPPVKREEVGEGAIGRAGDRLDRAAEVGRGIWGCELTCECGNLELQILDEMIRPQAEHQSSLRLTHWPRCSSKKSALLNSCPNRGPLHSGRHGRHCRH